jgi:hypothetical protein
MYRQGLGDCFLLTFGRKGAPLRMLVDCGVILGTPGQDEKMREVAEDLRRETGGRLDVLVATHEHWDHLSGFIQARDVFKDFEIEQLWLAWTEDLSHPLARKLRDNRKRALAGLARALPRLRAAGAKSSQRLENLLHFAGLGAAGQQTTSDALAFLREKVPQPRYCRPGENPIGLPGVPGVKVYVLGPPEDEKLIRKSDPTKKGKEVYEFAFSFEFEQGFLTALDREPRDGDGDPQMSPDEWERSERSLPFDRTFRIPAAAAASDPFFRRFYGPADQRDGSGKARKGDDGEDADDAEGQAWRRIDSDWLDAAGSLALKLDSDTNNTSLALAIELPKSGKVLLFPGDAQVGNWLSWAALTWPRGAAPDDEQSRTAAKLLARTVLYKVGHHASHNATARAQGLELMTDPGLVAFIPVDETIAREKKDWDMPFAPLLKRLKERTRGRVLRADAGFPAPAEKPDTISAAEWKAFEKSTTVTPLYVEITVRDG